MFSYSVFLQDLRFPSLLILVYVHVHVVSTYDALIKTPNGREGNIHPTGSTLLVCIAFLRVFRFVFKLVFYVF